MDFMLKMKHTDVKVLLADHKYIHQSVNIHRINQKKKRKYRYKNSKSAKIFTLIRKYFPVTRFEKEIQFIIQILKDFVPFFIDVGLLGNKSWWICLQNFHNKINGI